MTGTALELIQHVRQKLLCCSLLYMYSCPPKMMSAITNTMEAAWRLWKHNIRTFNIFAVNGWIKKARSPFPRICWLNQLNSSKKTQQNRMCMLGPTLQAEAVSVLQCFIFSDPEDILITHTDNNNYRAYLLSGAPSLRASGGYCMNIQRNSWTPFIQFWLKCSACLASETHRNLRALSHTRLRGGEGLRRLICLSWYVKKMFSNNKLGEDLCIASDTEADISSVYRASFVINFSLKSRPRDIARRGVKKTSAHTWND